jgi:hypothetical protein
MKSTTPRPSVTLIAITLFFAFFWAFGAFHTLSPEEYGASDLVGMCLLYAVKACLWGLALTFIVLALWLCTIRQKKAVAC